MSPYTPGPRRLPASCSWARSWSGEVVWSLTAEGWFSYRAHRGPVADATPPAIRVAGIRDGDTRTRTVRYTAR